MRTMRSIVAWSATPSASSFSASMPNGRAQRLARKPGPSRATITRLPIRSPDRAGRLDRLRRRTRIPATTSSSSISGRRVEEVHADHAAPGRAAAVASAGHRQGGGVGREHRLRPADLRELREQARASAPCSSGAASITRSQRRGPRARSARCRRCSASSASPAGPAAALDALLEAGARPAPARARAPRGTGRGGGSRSPPAPRPGRCRRPSCRRRRRRRARTSLRSGTSGGRSPSQ